MSTAFELTMTWTCVTSLRSRLQVLDMSRSLEFEWTEFDDEKILQLMKGQCLQLRDLSISGLSEYGMKYLRGCPWKSLKRLQLSNCEISSDETDCLAQAYLPNLQELSVVNLKSPYYKSFPACALHANGNWPMLEKLELCEARTTPGHFRVVAAGNWPNLHTLILTDVIFDCEAVPGQGIDILASGNWPCLQTVVFKVR